MIPYKSVYKFRLENGGDIVNPELFSLLSTCMLSIKPDPDILLNQKANDTVLKGCLILKTIHYSLEHDPDYNYALGLIEYENLLQEKYPKLNLCHLLGYQKNPECDADPKRQKKIQILYEKDFERPGGSKENVFIETKQIAWVFEAFCKASDEYKENKNSEDQIEFLQISIVLSERQEIKGWNFFLNDDDYDVEDITSYLQQPYLIKDPIENKNKIESWFKKNPESLYYLYMLVGRRRNHDQDKAINCFLLAVKFARKVFGELSREAILAEYEILKMLGNHDSENRRLKLLLNKMQTKFLQIIEKPKNSNQESENSKNAFEENKNEVKKDKEEEEEKKNVFLDVEKKEIEESLEADSKDDENENLDEEFLEEHANDDEDEQDEFIVSPVIDLDHSDIHPIDKILFASMILEQEDVSYFGYEKAREVFEKNPYNKEKLAFCYFKIAEVMLEIIDERTNYFNFFGNSKIEFFSLQGVRNYLNKAYQIISEGFGNFDSRMKDVVFELIKVNKRLNDFAEAYKYCIIALHILKKFHSNDGVLMKGHQQRLAKKKYQRFQALSCIILAISNSNVVKKTLKRKEIIMEMIMQMV